MSSLVFISGVGMTPFGRSDLSLGDLMVQAGLDALTEAGLETVDALYLGVMNPAEFTGDSNLAALVADSLDLPGVPATRVETASSTGAGVLEAAFYAVASGYVKSALVLAGEKMTHLPTGQTTRILARVIDKVERQYGASMPALAAMIARRYATEYGLSEDDLARSLASVAIKNHAAGLLNPNAQFRREIDLEKYLSSKVIADPLRIYDCAPITDGAAAVILTTKNDKITLAGMGHATDTLAVGRRGSLTSFNSTKLAAQKAYKMAQLNPAQINLAEIHDAFTMFEIIGTEDLGFFEPGGGWKAALEGWTGPKGRLPVNASGGLKSRGHPVGASGLAQVVELCWQLRQEAEAERQLENVNIGLAQSIGGLANNNLVTILKRTDYRQSWQVNFQPDYHMEIYPPRPMLKLDSLKPGKGELLTWTKLFRPPAGFDPPVHLGYVRMGDGAVVLALGQTNTQAQAESGAEPAEIVEQPLPQVGDKVSLDVSGEHFVYKPYDPNSFWKKPLSGLQKHIYGWWSATTGTASTAARNVKAARLKDSRRRSRKKTENQNKGEPSNNGNG